MDSTIISDNRKPAKNFSDVTGQKFGRLTAKKLLGRNVAKKYVYLCVCDCGREIRICKGSFVYGNTKSCGCLKKYSDSTRFLKGTGVAAKNFVISYYKNNARKANRQFTLSDESLCRLFDGNCFYCGTVPRRVSKSRGSGYTFVYNGIDRVDPSKGYTLDNVVSCCTACNIAKQEFGLQEFKDWVTKVHSHMKL